MNKGEQLSLLPSWLIPSPRYFAKINVNCYCSGVSVSFACAVLLKRMTPLGSE